MRARGNDETRPEMGHMRLGKPNRLLHKQLTIMGDDARAGINVSLAKGWRFVPILNHVSFLAEQEQG